ncbi:hypothetical protein N7540_006069 [Penicillium herquei]|nr:hypothetical protein N7540_006069 [Penicillium herquei]
MNSYLLDHPGNQTLSGLRFVAINVLGFAGYGQKQEWAPDSQSLAQNIQGEKGLYFKTISLVAEMLLEAALSPAALLKLWFMPSRLQLLGYHKEKMPTYTKAMLDMERKTLTHDPSIQKSFLKILVKCSDEAKGLGTSGLSLTDDEISGNLFIFSIAGFETTANTMGYAVTLLAIYPAWQTWIREEIQNLLLDPLAWKYDEVFPRSKRILAIMVSLPYSSYYCVLDRV